MGMASKPELSKVEFVVAALTVLRDVMLPRMELERDRLRRERNLYRKALEIIVKRIEENERDGWQLVDSRDDVARRALRVGTFMRRFKP